jgi:hypothetical protein
VYPWPWFWEARRKDKFFFGHIHTTICKEFHEIWFSLFTLIKIIINEVQHIEKKEKKKEKEKSSAG